MYFFKPYELAKIAMEIEKNGRAFYEALAEKAEEKEAKTLFSFMAKEEEEHYDIFKKMSAKLESYEMPEVDEEDYGEYMRELVDSHVFAADINVDEVARKVGSSVEAVDLALNFEKDTIIFFSHLKKIMPSDDQDTLEELVKEENRHIKKLLSFKKMISTTSEDFYKSQKTWDSERQ